MPKTKTNKYDSVFATKLRELIEERSTTIKDVAEHLGFSRQAVSQYYNGDTQPNVDAILKIAEYFNVSCDYLLRGISSENLSISEETGLSEEAISSLKALNEYKCTLQALDKNNFGYERVFVKTFEIDAINKLLEHSADSFLTHILADLQDLDIPRKSVLPDAFFKLLVSNTELAKKITTRNILSELEYFVYSKEQLLKKLLRFIEAVYIYPKLKEVIKDGELDEDTRTELLSLYQEYEIVLSDKWDVVSITQNLQQTYSKWLELENDVDLMLDSSEEVNYADNNEAE